MKNSYTGLLLILSAALFSCSSPRSENKDLSAAVDSIIIENIFPFQQQHCHGSSITSLPNGDLLVVWFQGSGERTADDVAIMGSRRNHNSGEWCEPFVMADVPGFPDINPVVFTDLSGRLWLAWYTVLAYQWESSVLKYRISENYLQESGPPEWKWQDMIHVKPDGSVPDGIGHNDSFVKTLERKYAEYHSYLISSGTLSGEGSAITESMWDEAVARYFEIARGTNLMSTGTETAENGERVRTRLGYPLMRRIGWQTRNKPLFYGDRMLLPLYSDGFDFSMIAMTDDGGQSWSFSEPIVGAGPVQPALVTDARGNIVAYMRDNGPPPQRLMMSASPDTGRTWSLVTDTGIPNPGSAADIVKLKSGNWVIVSNDTDEGRHRLSLWLSDDEGKTWPWRKSIVNGEPGSQTRAHYPAIIQDQNGIIHVSYTNQVTAGDGNSNVKNIAHAFFTEDWLLK